jgi:hypothetical protein
MRLKMRQNVPHRAMGPYGKGKNKPMPGGGTHVPQRTESGFKDSKGYQGSAKIAVGQRQSGAVPKIPREAGHYHPLDTRVSQGGTRGLMGDISDARAFGKEVPTGGPSARRDGYHSGKASKGDTSLLKGANKGNSHGTPPTALSARPGVRGSPDSHLGTAGRGGTGRIGKHDAYKGAPTKYTEDISHSSFEKLGAD